MKNYYLVKTTRGCYNIEFGVIARDEIEAELVAIEVLEEKAAIKESHVKITHLPMYHVNRRENNERP